tara:strand:+ start:3615 stop:4253 length:639 start_codon:yes stop_codon:yes gene_type:complete
MVLETIKRFAGGLFGRGDNNSSSTTFDRFGNLGNSNIDFTSSSRSPLTSFAATKSFLDRNPSTFGSSSLLRNAPRFGPEVYSPGFGDASGISFSDSLKLQSLSNDKDNRSFRDKFSAGVDEGKSYADSFKKGNGDNRMAGTIFGGGNAASAQLAPNLSIYDEKSLYPTGIIQGQAGRPGLFSARGAIGGGIKGFIGGGPAGALGGALMGGFG